MRLIRYGMDWNLVIQAMQHDIGLEQQGNRALSTQWFCSLHPMVFAHWSTPLTADPIHVIEAMLSQQCPADISLYWWRRYGFLAQDADTLLMLVDRDPSLENIVGMVVEGALWHIARGYMVHYSVNDCQPPSVESSVDMAAARRCARRWWLRLWRQPQLAVKTPALHDLIVTHPTTVSALWADEPEEAYLAQLGATSFMATRHRACFYAMLLDTFPQHHTAIHWLEQDGTAPEQAWSTIWSMTEHAGQPPTQVDAPADIV